MEVFFRPNQFSEATELLGQAKGSTVALVTTWALEIHHNIHMDSTGKAECLTYIQG